MSKPLTYAILLAGILIPQLFFSSYWAVVLVWIITGMLVSSVRRIFLNGFMLQLIIGGILFFLWSAAETKFLRGIPEEFDVPGFVMPLFAMLFNALNVGFCLLGGAVLVRLLFNRKPEKKRTY